MGSYRLRESVEALQYIRNDNEAQVAELIKGDGGVSFSNHRGHLELWNLNGWADRVAVEQGEWVVKVGSGFSILSDSEFTALFVAD